MTASEFRDCGTRHLRNNVDEKPLSSVTLDSFDDSGVEEGDVSNKSCELSSWPIKMEERRGLRITTWNGMCLILYC
jgi:hypothetical protein